jgi:hypothetical protein
MTDVAAPPSIDRAGPRPARAVPTLAAGLFGGFTLGVIARAWMRLIAEDPEFTWGGTIFIVLAFTIFGFTQSIAALVRGRARRRWTLTIARGVGTIGFMPLFVGAGSIMLPTVVGGGLAVWRTDWNRVVRALCALAALGPVVIVGTQLAGSFGYSLHALAGFVGMVAIYATIIAATRFTIEPRADGWRMKRRVKIPIFVVLGLVLTYSLVGIVG